MRKLFLLLTAALVVALACERVDDDTDPEPNEPQTLELQPDSTNGKDAYIEDYELEGYRDRNFGHYQALQVQSWTDEGYPYVIRSLIEFNLGQIPSFATIDSARLSLYAHGNQGHGYGHDTLGGSNACYIHRITSEWGENTVTWNKHPEFTTLNTVTIPRSENPMQDYINIDVTQLVRDSHNNPSESHGFLIRLQKEYNYRRMAFASSDAEEEHKHPRLEVYFIENE